MSECVSEDRVEFIYVAFHTLAELGSPLFGLCLERGACGSRSTANFILKVTDDNMLIGNRL